MKNNRAQFLVLSMAVAFNLPVYSMDRGWLGSATAALSSTSIGSYVSSMRKEDIKLAGGLIGGMCLGAGCLALYQAVKYRGMKMITTAHADIAHIVNVAGTTHDWNLFDQTGKYKRENVYALVNRLGIESDFAEIKPEEKVALLEINTFMRRSQLTSAHALQVVRDASAFQEKVCRERLMSLERLRIGIQSHLTKAHGMKIKEINIHTDHVYDQQYYDSLCLRAYMHDNTVTVVPTHVLTYVLNDAGLEVPSMGKLAYKEPKKIGKNKCAKSMTSKSEE